LPDCTDFTTNSLWDLFYSTCNAVKRKLRESPLRKNINNFINFIEYHCGIDLVYYLKTQVADHLSLEKIHEVCEVDFSNSKFASKQEFLEECQIIETWCGDSKKKRKLGFKLPFIAFPERYKCFISCPGEHEKTACDLSEHLAASEVDAYVYTDTPPKYPERDPMAEWRSRVSEMNNFVLLYCTADLFSKKTLGDEWNEWQTIWKSSAYKDKSYRVVVKFVNDAKPPYGLESEFGSAIFAERQDLKSVANYIAKGLKEFVLRENTIGINNGTI
jgi:hypothetical protein